MSFGGFSCWLCFLSFLFGTQPGKVYSQFFGILKFLLHDSFALSLFFCCDSFFSFTLLCCVIGLCHLLSLVLLILGFFLSPVMSHQLQKHTKHGGGDIYLFWGIDKWSSKTNQQHTKRRESKKKIWTLKNNFKKRKEIEKKNNSSIRGGLGIIHK